MGLETGTYVNDLNTANPTSTDPKSQGDDHLRLIKTVLKNTFAGLAGPIIAFGVEAQGATTNDYVVTVSPAPAAYVSGFFVVFKATHANGGAVTLALNALAPIAVKDVDGNALSANAILNGALCVVWYDGTNFYLISANGLQYAPTPPVGDNSTRICTTAFAVQLAFQAALPAQAGNAGKVLKTDGANAYWSSVDVKRSVRTANTQLVSADASTLIDITSGTFTQTFTAAATLGNGWWCYLHNSGTGDITLDPNGAETIDGLTSYIMYPGECRLVQCDGIGFNSIVLDPFYKVFTASGTFTRPPGYTMYAGFAWGGGGSGGKRNDMAGGGGGGACAPFTIDYTTMGASQTITVGAGGTAATSDLQSGSAGGTTTIGALVAAYGGGGGWAGDAYAGGGGGGGLAGTGQTGSSYSSQGGVGFDSANVTSGGGANGGGQKAVYGGGGGGGSNASATQGYPPGGSLFGGGGGGTCKTTTVGSTSVYGGNGGAGGIAVNGTNGSIPGGGGGATSTGAQSGAGARGEVRIWGVS